jgi:aerobic-type carbon monoxide dehydrogenase small subunit (CoxS/CutS family)
MATRKLKAIRGKKGRLRKAPPAAFGPGPVPIQLKINGQTLSAIAEPCLTLLQVLREKLGVTGAKQVCDRATCGACTVLADGRRIYACSLLAIDAQDLEITTIESLAENGELDSLQQAFVDADASQCGYCTSGFVMSAKAFLDENPAPTLHDIKKGMCGNLCRCGTYAGIAEALLAMSGTKVQSKRRRAHG